MSDEQEKQQEVMQMSNSSIRVRPARDVRLIEQGGMVVAYPEPHRTPVLPSGWAPLSREQQQAVLGACDSAPESLVFRLGSLWEPGAEYRVYRLANELWRGLSIVSKACGGHADARATVLSVTFTNQQLIGLAWDTIRAVAIAVDFFNWDLQAHGQPWRLDVRATGAEHS
jgi:hypothetical protein